MNLSEIFREILQTNQFISEITASIIIFSLAAAIGWLSFYIFAKYLSKYAKKTKTTLDDDILRNTKTVIALLIILFGFYYAIGSMTIIAPYSEQIFAIFAVLEIMLIAFAVTRVTNVLTDWYANRQSEHQIGKNNHLLFILKKLTQLLVYLSAFLALLAVFRIDLSGVILGLGIGGIAIAFALQNTLSDVFSAFSIYFDRPFEIGDFVVVGDYSGTVTNIGVKSTRIKLLQGEELVVSNKELTSEHVRNFRKLERRRVTFTIGVEYSTPLAKLKKIPIIISKIVSCVDLAEIDRVNFTEFGEYSLKFLVVYYVKVADYGKYMDIQETINFDIIEAFEKEGIEMAFPTHTIHMNKTYCRE